MVIEGGAQLASNLASLPRAVSKAIVREVLVEACEPMVAIARRMAPRRPGQPDIADNIEIGNVKGGTMDAFGDPRAMYVAWGPVKGFFYGYFLEWGTVKMSPRSFMRPGFDGGKEHSVDIIRDRTWEHIQSYVLSMDTR